MGLEAGLGLWAWGFVWAWGLVSGAGGREVVPEVLPQYPTPPVPGPPVSDNSSE